MAKSIKKGTTFRLLKNNTRLKDIPGGKKIQVVAKKLGPLINETVKQLEHLEKNYNREHQSIIDYLKKEGKIHPKDYSDFADWYLLYRHDVVLGGIIPPVEDKDFLLYHSWRETELHNKKNTAYKKSAREILKEAHTKKGSSLTRDEVKKLAGKKSCAYWIKEYFYGKNPWYKKFSETKRE